MAVVENSDVRTKGEDRPPRGSLATLVHRFSLPRLESSPPLENVRVGEGRIRPPERPGDSLASTLSQNSALSSTAHSSPLSLTALSVPAPSRPQLPSITPFSAPPSKFLAAYSLYENNTVDVEAESALKVKPEVFNHIFQGKDVFDKSGNSYHIVSWGEGEDSPPRGVSISKIEQGRASKIIQYDVASNLSPSQGLAAMSRLAEALEHFDRPNRFDNGIRRLDELTRSGQLSAQVFEPHQSPVVPGQFKAEEDFRAAIVRTGVDVSPWDRGSAKSVQALYREVEDGELKLHWSGRRGYVSENVVFFDLVHRHPETGERMRLIEEKQVLFRRDEEGKVFTEERIRKENGQSPAEKVKDLETVADAVRRGVLEELKISEIRSLKEVSFSRKIAQSQNYPGMFQCNVFRRFQVEINQRDFRETYQEVSETKITYFKWVPFSDADEQALFRIDQGK